MAPQGGVRGLGAAAATLAVSLPVWALVLAPAWAPVWADDAPAPDPALLASDLPASIAAAVADAPAETRLQKIFEAAEPYRFTAGPVAVSTDRRWFQTLPSDAAGAPLLEVRRWPGDSILAIYAAAPGSRPEGKGLTWSAEGSRGELVRDCSRWRVTWHTPPVPEAAAAVGVLLLSGDGGLGPAAAQARAAELHAAASRIDVDASTWKRLAPPPPGTEWVLPALPATCPSADERRDGWQAVAVGSGSMSFPPGVQVRGTDRGVVAPRPVPGQVLWLRGRFTDREGHAVRVGDAQRAGYVAELAAAPPGWARGATGPAGIPGASRVAVEPFEVATERTGFPEATAGRWIEPGYEGEWLVFRLQGRGRGIEIGLPVAEGRTSPALFWIPTTWRGPGQPPAPPPVDVAERSGIRFEPPLPAEAQRDPGLGGRLTAPGVRAEVPKGWFPRATQRTADGFPVQFVDAKGRVWGTLERLDPGEADPPAAEGWQAVRRPAAWGAVTAWTRPDGALALRGGDGALWRLLPEAGAEKGRWERLSGRLVLMAPPRRRGR